MINFITGTIGSGKRLVANGLIFKHLAEERKVIIVEHGQNKNYHFIEKLLKTSENFTDELLILPYNEKEELAFLKEMLKAKQEKPDEKIVLFFDDVRSVTEEFITECVSFLIDERVESYFITDTIEINDKLMQRISQVIPQTNIGEIKGTVFTAKLDRISL